MIRPILAQRFKAVFKKNLSPAQKEELVQNLCEAHVQERLVVELLPNGKPAYFFRFKPMFMGEFEEVFFYVTNTYCVDDRKIRKKFYEVIHQKAREMATYENIKRIAFEVSFEDALSREYGASKGFLTYIELVGHTQTGLDALKKIIPKKSLFKFSNLKKEDVEKLVVLDQKAHLADRTSRMNKIFSKPDARKGMRRFYYGVLKHGNCFVAREKNKLAGDLAFFSDPINKWGLIASIFVAEKSQNKGLSFELYQKVLQEFKKRKFEHYLGATTTIGVLKSASRIGRVEFRRCYILKM